jgi:hypothetical protein
MPASESLSLHLRELEESLLQPDVRKSNDLVALLADDFIEFGSSGRVYSKADVVAVLQDETPSTQTTNDLKVALFSPQVALPTYRIRDEVTPPAHTLRSSVWQLRGDRWQMVFHQATLTTAPQ